MSIEIKYNGSTIASASTDTTKTLQTAGKYCEGDVEVINTQDGGITPGGSISIVQNGTFDVEQYAEAIVNVSGGGGNAEQAIFGVAPLPADGHIGDRSWDNGYLGTAAFKYTSGGAEYTVWFLPVQGGHIYNFSNTNEAWSTAWSRIHFYKKRTEPVAIPYVEKGFKIPSISWTPVVYISYADAGTGHSLQIQAPENADFICISYTRKYADDYLTATFEEAT